MDLTGRRLIFAQHVKLAPGNLVALNGVLLSMEGAHVVDEATRDRRIQFFRGNVFACIAQLRSALPLGSAIGSSNLRNQDTGGDNQHLSETGLDAELRIPLSSTGGGVALHGCRGGGNAALPSGHSG